MRIHGFLASIVAIAATGGIYFTVTRLLPTTATQILLLSLLFVAIAALAIPTSIALNNRFASETWFTADPARVWRHAVESGAFVALIALLQLRQSLTVMAVVSGLIIVIVIESAFIAKT